MARSLQKSDLVLCYRLSHVPKPLSCVAMNVVRTNQHLFLYTGQSRSSRSKNDELWGNLIGCISGVTRNPERRCGNGQNVIVTQRLRRDVEDISAMIYQCIGGPVLRSRTRSNEAVLGRNIKRVSTHPGNIISLSGYSYCGRMICIMLTFWINHENLKSQTRSDNHPVPVKVVWDQRGLLYSESEFSGDVSERSNHSWARIFQPSTFNVQLSILNSLKNPPLLSLDAIICICILSDLDCWQNSK